MSIAAASLESCHTDSSPATNDPEVPALRYCHTKRRCSDTDNDPDRCSVAVWSLESCQTDSSPATNYADLEKEVEELKSKPMTGGADDVVQALTDRLDAVLLEKAETHQQLVSMKKELAKTKEEFEVTAKKASELQHLEHSNNTLLGEIAALKSDLSQSQINHKEDVDTLKKELQDALMKQKEFTERLSQQEERDKHVTKLEKQHQRMHQDYEERISHLQKDLDSLTEEKDNGMAKLKDAQAASEQYFSEIQDLHAKILELQALHKEEVSNLMHELESSTNESEKDKSTLQEIINQYHERDKMLEEDNKLRKNNDISKEQNVATESEDNEVQKLKSAVKELDSQQSLLHDELTYTNNLKIGLEREVQHLKSEYFHEREELEFKINELQLAIEEYHSLIEKLKTELESTKEDYRQLSQQKTIDIQGMRDQHKKEMYELKQSILSRYEDEKLSFVHEIHILKEQCEKLHHEKEEAVNSYENLRETFVSLQAELQDSAGKISREFETMKNQQATDVHELQQKLRAAYKDKNDLLETVNQLHGKVDGLASKESECEELQVKITKLHENNEEHIASLHQKEELIKELQLKVNEDSHQNAEISVLHEEIQKLQEMYKSEQVAVEAMQREAENQAELNAQLKKTVEELTEKLQESVLPSHQSDTEDPQLQITWWQQKNEEVTANLHAKEQLLKDLHLKIEETTRRNTELSSSKEHANQELLDIKEMLKSEQMKALGYQQEAENHVTFIAHLEQKVEELTQKLSTTEQSLEEMKNLQQQIDSLHLDKQKTETDTRRWQDELSQLCEEKNVLANDFDRLRSEHSRCLSSTEELGDLRKKVQLISEEKDEVTRLLTSKELHIETFGQQLYILQDVLTIECTDQDFMALLENINKAVLQLKEEKENLISQKKETSAQLERLHDEYEMQCSDLRALLSDYSKEKVLLKEELEETLRDKEALQGDLLDMKHTLEKSKLDNHDLLSCIESLTADLNILQKEKHADVASSERAQEALMVKHKEGMEDVTDGEAQHDFITMNDVLGPLIRRADVDVVRFAIDQDHYQFVALPFGLAMAPRVFTKVMASTMDVLHSRGIVVVPYLDKLLIKAPSFKDCELSVSLTIDSHGLAAARVCQLPKLPLPGGSNPPYKRPTALRILLFHPGLLSKSLDLEQKSLLADLQSKIENLEREAKEKDEKSNKIKAVAVKAKKELDANRKEVHSIKEELERVRAEKQQLTASMKDVVQGAESYQNLLVEYDKKVELLELEKEKVKSTEHQLEELSRQLRAATAELKATYCSSIAVSYKMEQTDECDLAVLPCPQLSLAASTSTAVLYSN
ncbi:unnamed protein product [Ranitomeya imitator]|uniref:Uncharacterized protein n=1 Tax=Ranitomeya imitator TaxID=111125 RepID=A0ABN9KMU0_9NEOB|nr:unnamed protein product [Ranitomeya imitator]